MITRNTTERLHKAMSDTPVILLQGARKTGKSTLARWYAEHVSGARYLTLDEATVLAAAAEDPGGFLSGLDGPVVLDEVQRAPGLFRAIKVEVDRDRRPGRFLLTGSTDVLLLPRLSESLAGRMEILTLWPFSLAELKGAKESFINAVFSKNRLGGQRTADLRAGLLDRVVTGGFPEVVSRTSPDRRHAWFGSYVTTVLQRDVRDIADVEHLTSLPRLLRLLATRSASLLNYSEIARTLGLAHSTLRRYMALLETTFLVQILKPWWAHLGKRLVKSPKVMLCDTGLMAHLLGVDSGQNIPAQTMGPLVENYAFMELRKQVDCNAARIGLYHYREQTGNAIDLILENAAGDVAAIEVKASSTVDTRDFKHLKALREKLGSRFLRGIVLYLGQETIAFEERMAAVPLAALASEGVHNNHVVEVEAG